MRRTLVALVVVLVAGPALAAGGATAGSVDTESSASVAAGGGPVFAAQQTGGCEYPTEVTDATGETIPVEEPDEVVVTAQNVAQHIWDLGAEENVVGLPHANTGYLPNNTEPTDVGAFELKIETIVGLEPDLVLAPNATFKEDIRSLRDAGLTVYHYRKATDLSSVTQRVERTGQLVGACEAADNLTAEMQSQIATIEQAVSDVDRPKLYYSLGSSFTAAAGTVEHDIITTAGATNIAADVGQRDYPQINAEVVTAEDPEWIVVPTGRNLSTAAQGTTAAQEGQIIRVEPHLLSQHGPRNVDALAQIAERLHPDALADVQTDAGTGTNGSNAAGGANNTTDGNESSDGSGPGLTVVAAALALGVLVVVARYRQ